MLAIAKVTTVLILMPDKMIGHDSGPMHLAAVTGIPVIALFGPTDETLWGPLSERAVIVRGSEACDSGCRRGRCQQNFRCMRSLAPEQVIAAAHAVLQSRSLWSPAR